MDNALELNFLNTYIVREKKERLIYEFANSKKREYALLRFSHDVENIIKSNFIQYRCNAGNLNIHFNISKDVYVISLSKIEGEFCPYEEAIAHLNCQYMPVIIIADNYVIIKSEDGDSKDNIFVLTKPIGH